MRMRKEWMPVWLAMAAMVAIGGCAPKGEYLGRPVAERADREFQARVDRIEQEMEAREREQQRMQRDMERPVHTAVPYVSTAPVPIRRQLPPIFERQITFHEPYPTPIGLVMAKLSHATGLRVVFEYDLVDSRARTGNTGANPGLDSARTEIGVIDLEALAGQALTGQDNLLSNVRMQLSHQGRVRDVFDAAANAMEASWRFDERTGRVVFFRYVTATMRIAMTSGRVSNRVQLETAGDSARAGNVGSNLSFEGSNSVWESLEGALETMISSRGAFSVSDVTGTVTVRDVPDVVSRIREYVDRLNETFSRQVMVDVHVFRVEASESDFRGVNWAALFNRPEFGINITTPASAGSMLGVGSALLSIPERAAGRSTRAFVGSEAFLESLNQVGKASLVTSTTLQTVNNQPAPVRVGQTIAYLQSVSQTDTANVGSSVTLTPGQIDVGFAMQVLPHVQDNGRDILMQIMLTLSRLDDIKEFSSGVNRIQLPEVSSRDFVQRTWLQSGDSLVLAGFESVQADQSRRGIVDARAWGFGGSRQLGTTKESLVIVITPTVASIRDRI